MMTNLQQLGCFINSFVDYNLNALVNFSGTIRVNDTDLIIPTEIFQRLGGSVGTLVVVWVAVDRVGRLILANKGTAIAVPRLLLILRQYDVISGD